MAAVAVALRSVFNAKQFSPLAAAAAAAAAAVEASAAAAVLAVLALGSVQ